MARYWLSSCDLGKLIVALSDLMSSAGKRKFNYDLRLFCEPVKINSKLYHEEMDNAQRKQYILERWSLETIIKVSFTNNFMIK